MCKSAPVVKRIMNRIKFLMFLICALLLPPRLFFFYFAEAESENVAPPSSPSPLEPDTMANFDDVSVIAASNCNGKCFVNYM